MVANLGGDHEPPTCYAVTVKSVFGRRLKDGSQHVMAHQLYMYAALWNTRAVQLTSSSVQGLQEGNKGLVALVLTITLAT